jgi:hypothetical protein
MPVHDWQRVDRSYFHSFYLGWVARISADLNVGVLPSAYYALCENIGEAHRPAFLELAEPEDNFVDPGKPGAIRSCSESPPRTWLHSACDRPEYAEKVISVRRCDDHQVAAAIRILSGDSKHGRHRFASLMEWAVGAIRAGIHLLLVDPFPPGRHDPDGIHKAIRDEFQEEDVALPSNKPLLLASYEAEPLRAAYVEPVGAGDALPDMPLFLEADRYVPVPLEASYQAEWDVFPAALKGLLEAPPRPAGD